MMNVDQLYEMIQTAETHEKFNHWLTYTPYPKQRLFMELGAQYIERLLTAGNQVGKSDCGAYETSRHLTGVYPDWWKGLRFDQNSGPAPMWVAGTAGEAVRDNAQAKLFGPPGIGELFGTGFVPKECIVGEPTHSRSATNLIDTIHVRHISGAIVPCGFKTYKQSREDWQGPTKRWLWFDEEPPLDIYTEGLARLSATGGSHILTFTPLKGYSDVVKRFLECPPQFAHLRTFIQMALTDAAHMTPEKIAQTLSSYPEHEWAARRDGDPHLSGGLIFTANPNDLMEDQYALGLGQTGMPLPSYWPCLWGIDFGAGGETGHPFAAVLLAWDREFDSGHIIRGFRTSERHPAIHAQMIRSIAANTRVAWPHDGHVADKGGDQLQTAEIYRKHGLNMMHTHATHKEGGYATEPGLFDLDTAMREGRFHVNRAMGDWFQEYRLYHRDDDGKIVKVNDDLMSATRIAWMARREARVAPLGSKVVPKRRTMVGATIDPHTGRPVGNEHASSILPGMRGFLRSGA